MAETGERGGHVDIGDTRLWIVERGPKDGPPVLLLHGGPGLDHHEFGDYLDPLADAYRLILVDQRAQGRSDAADPSTWTLDKMAEDVLSAAQALRLDRYAVLGHSYGAFVSLQNAVDFPGMAAASIVSSGMPSARFLADVEANLDAFRPVEMRDRVHAAWDLEPKARTREDVVRLLHDQMPFHFADPGDPRIAEFERRTGDAVYAPAVLRHFAQQQYGGIDVEDLLHEVVQPVLVLAGRHDRTCPVEAAQLMATGIPNAELVVFEQSGHMTYVEENDRYVEVVRSFLDRTLTR